MKVRYFSDTDTLLLMFNDNPIAETRDLTEYILVELDKEGGLVSLTVEHATKQTNVHEFSYQEIAR